MMNSVPKNAHSARVKMIQGALGAGGFMRFGITPGGGFNAGVSAKNLAIAAIEAEAAAAAAPAVWLIFFGDCG